MPRDDPVGLNHSALGSVDFVKILLDANANVNAIAENNRTPLHRTVHNTTGKRTDIVAVLMGDRRRPNDR